MTLSSFAQSISRETPEYITIFTKQKCAIFIFWYLSQKIKPSHLSTRTFARKEKIVHLLIRKMKLEKSQIYIKQSSALISLKKESVSKGTTAVLLMGKKSWDQPLIYSKQPSAICGHKENALQEKDAVSHMAKKIWDQRNSLAQ